MKRLVVVAAVLFLLGVGFAAGRLAQLKDVGAAPGKCQSETHAEARFCLDTNGDGDVNLTDGVHVLNFLFLGDPKADDLHCECPAHEAPHLRARIAQLEGQVAQCQADLDEKDKQLAQCVEARDQCYIDRDKCYVDLTQCQTALSTRGQSLPATGQTECNGGAGNPIECDKPTCPGQDAAYQIGCGANGTRFLDNEDGTVTDTCTGLMWQQQTAPGTFNWCDALVYCEDLILAGHDDWRLPNVRELESIVDYGHENPAIDQRFFEAVSDQYWSSTAGGETPSVAATVGFIMGGINFPSDGKGAIWHVRAVRTVPIPPPIPRLPATGQTKCWKSNGEPDPTCTNEDHPGQDGVYQAGCPMEGRFKTHSDVPDVPEGTVVDNCTGLMWQQQTADWNGDGSIDDKDKHTWSAALKYCEDLQFAGFDDWRLPNVRELQSIVVYGSEDMTMDPQFLWSTGGYWSSTSVMIPSSDRAWSIVFEEGIHHYGSAKGQLINVRAVRTIQPGE